MSHPFNRIGKRMGKVVHWINAPLVPRAIMMGMADAIEQWVTHLHVGGSHVNLGAQHMRAIGKLTSPHAAKEVEILLHATIAMGTCATCLCHGPAVFANLFFIQTV